MTMPSATQGPGKLRNGFNMIARDLDRAFALAMLGTYEAFMLQVVREESWVASVRQRRKGQPMPDARPCKPNLSGIARQTGLNRCLVSRGLNDLVAARVLDRSDDGSLTINKDYSQWVFPGANPAAVRPRFNTTQLTYIREVARPDQALDCYPQVAEEDPETATQEYQPLLPTGSSAATQEYQGTDVSCYPGVSVAYRGSRAPRV